MKLLNDYYREKFGCKIVKVSLNAGLGCPNKDGTKGYGGCIFCTETPFIGDENKPLETQFEEIKTLLSKKWKDCKYIAFLEYGSNTYASVEELKSIYEPLLKIENVVGIDIATRCDCLNDEILDYLEDLNKRTYLTIELGLESCHNDTLKLLNRHHTKEDFIHAVKKLKKRNIEVVAQIINGLPYETEEMMLETIDFLNELNIDGIKFHMLYIEQGTKLEEIYQMDKFHILTMDEYIDIVVKQIKKLNDNIVIHRLTSGPDKNKLIEPKWLNNKFKIINAINKAL